MKEILIAQYLPSFALSAFVACLLVAYLWDLRNNSRADHLAFALAKGLAIWSIGYAFDRAFWGMARLTDWHSAYSMHWPVIANHLLIAYGLYVIFSTWASAKNRPHYTYLGIAAYLLLWAVGVGVQALH